MNVKNTRKQPGAYVWYKAEIMRILNNKVAYPFIVLTNGDKVKRQEVRLVKCGDRVSFKDKTLFLSREQRAANMKVTYIRYNDTIGTTSDYYKESDGVHYSHLQKPILATTTQAP
jgi:hypothetical protein